MVMVVVVKSQKGKININAKQRLFSGFLSVPGVVGKLSFRAACLS